MKSSTFQSSAREDQELRQPPSPLPCQKPYSKLRIGNVELDHWAVLAPMAGITNLAFRLLAKEMGAGLVYSEMVSANGLVLGQKRTLEYLKTDPAEAPLAVQIFGAEPQTMARAAEIVAQKGFSILDINLGCPVKKVTKTGSGAALLRDRHRLSEIIRAVRKVWPRALTAKLRAGWSPPKGIAHEIAAMLQDLGVDAVSIHPRFATQGFSGQAHWPIIAQVRKAVSIPVIGNGDVFSPQKAFDMRVQTGCHGVMIARGAIGNPWIFRQIIDMEKGKEPRGPTVKERKVMIMRHFHLLAQERGEAQAARLMRGLLLWYTKGLPNSSRFRGAIGRIKDLDSLTREMEKYFNTLERGEP